MADAFHHGLLASAPRPVRKKFAKPPVKVACLPWCVQALRIAPVLANNATVAPLALDAAAKSPALM